MGHGPRQNQIVFYSLFLSILFRVTASDSIISFFGVFNLRTLRMCAPHRVWLILIHLFIRYIVSLFAIFFFFFFRQMKPRQRQQTYRITNEN